MKYADRRGAAIAVIEGGDERAKGEVTLKDLALGAELAKSVESRAAWTANRQAQISVKRADLVAEIKGMLSRKGRLMAAFPYYDAAAIGALNDQAVTLLKLFAARGYVREEPSILQPAEIFLDRSGEEIRRRTFTLTDPSGRELALRPDLTIPICQHAVESGAKFPAAAFPITAWSSAISPSAPSAPHPVLPGRRGIAGAGRCARRAKPKFCPWLRSPARRGLEGFRVALRRSGAVRRAGGCPGTAAALARAAEAAFLARRLCRDLAAPAGPGGGAATCRMRAEHRSACWTPQAERAAGRPHP